MFFVPSVLFVLFFAYKALIGAIMGIGIGVAIGFGIANANLTHLLTQHVSNTTHTINPYPSTKVS